MSLKSTFLNNFQEESFRNSLMENDDIMDLKESICAIRTNNNNNNEDEHLLENSYNSVNDLQNNNKDINNNDIVISIQDSEDSNKSTMLISFFSVLF